MKTLEHSVRAALVAGLIMLPTLPLAAQAAGGTGSSTAQTAGTGTVQGRVYNPVVQQYVRNAEVRLEGTNRVATTGADGSFTFLNVPAGSAVVVVNYTGYATARETLRVDAGRVATTEVSLATLGAGPAQGEEVISLQAFTVSSEREGNAKAIMEQRQNMNITTSVASDIFGDVTDGNVGEFLKYLPGLDLEYVESETRGPRLGGLDAHYVGVTIDGVTLASADNSGNSNLSRGTSFEAFSISSVEAIEIHRTTSPDMDANSPAGVINLKTRRAFERKGRRISYNTSLSLNSEEFHLKRTYGPGGLKEYKARPNYSFEFSDVFLNDRLGVVASYSHVDSYTEQYRLVTTYNRNPTPDDPRPMVATALAFKDGNKNIEKDTFTLNVDFKATPNLVLSNTFIYNYVLGQYFNRNLVFTAASNNANALTGRQTVQGNGMTELRTSTNGLANAQVATNQASKRTHTVTWAPRFEYTIGALTVEGVASYSRSRNFYRAFDRGHSALESLSNVQSQWVATRPDQASYEWTVQQVSGPDWFDFSNHKNPGARDEGRFATTEIYNGQLDFRWITPLQRFPLTIKFGGKMNEEYRNYGDPRTASTYSYIGPGGNVVTGVNPLTGVPIISPVGSWAGFENRNYFSTGSTNMLTLRDASGQLRPNAIPIPDPHAIGKAFGEHPEWFVNIATPANYYTSFIQTRRNIQQNVTAGYAMGDIRFSDRLTVRTGIRWENTENIAKEFDPRTSSEVVVAGFPVNAAGVPTTIAGYEYQYLSKPRIERKKDYDDFFPMISMKYYVRPDLEFQVGANRAIARPQIDLLTGVWNINDETATITSPNPNLLPEYSRNIVARLAYYFQPASQFSVAVNQNTVRNSRITRRGTAEEFGYGNLPEYAAYEFVAPFNVDDSLRYRGFELAYTQTLPFRHEALRGITINSSYTRTYATDRRSGLLPHRVTSSLGYAYRNFRARLGMVWRDDTPEGSTEADYGAYRKADTKFDLSAEYRLSSRLSLYFHGRNIFNDGQTWMLSPPGEFEGRNAAVQRYENYGSNWNFGIKGTF